VQSNGGKPSTRRVKVKKSKQMTSLDWCWQLSAVEAVLLRRKEEAQYLFLIGFILKSGIRNKRGGHKNYGELTERQ